MGSCKAALRDQKGLKKGSEKGEKGTWRFMGSQKWSYKSPNSPNIGYNYSYPTYNHP